MRIGIGTLAILGVAAVTAATVGVISGINLRTHEQALVAQLKRSADHMCEVIASTTYHDMLENRRDALHRQITTIGSQGEAVERVRLLNKAGMIMFSSDEAEVGHVLDTNAEACYACHAAGKPLERLPLPSRARTFRASDGHRVLGMIRPIHNEEACWSADCHAHPRGQVVLGVLDVNLSMTEVDRGVAQDRRMLLLLAVIAIAASSLVLWALSKYFILRPVAALIAGTRRVAQGDLSTTIPDTGHYELADLARSFNEMTVRLNEAQRQLTQSDKLASVGRLAAGIAHEINNPLTGVLTYASFLLKRTQGNPEAAADLEVIVRETKRCREIVKGMLDFARQTPPRRQQTDLNEVVRRAATIVMNQLTLAKVRLGFELADSLEPVPADANQIQQVVVNLFLNAADAIAGRGSAEGGTITIRTSRVDVPPRGHAVIRAARCPKGCDLIDKEVRLAGAPSIRVLTRTGDREANFHLDPAYGCARHRASEQSDEGVVGQHLCPHCRTRLETANRKCEICGAPVFAVHVPGLGPVEWCTRKGCHFTRWEAMDARGPQAYAQVEVEDTGCGIAPEDLKRIFEPFYSTKGTKGTGLGLAVTWGIVEGHGGTIGIESEVGSGTRFTIRLPFSVTEATPAAGADAAARRAPMPSAVGKTGPGPIAPVAPRRPGEPGTSPSGAGGTAS